MIERHNEVYELLKVMENESDTLRMFLYMEDLMRIKIPIENDADKFVLLTTRGLLNFFNESERYFYWPQLKMYLDKLIYVYPYISFKQNKFDIKGTYSIDYLSEFHHKLKMLKMSYDFRENDINKSYELKEVIEKLLIRYPYIRIV